jgi:hypothetical protein
MKQKSQPWYLLYAAAVVELDPKQLNAWHGDTFVNGPAWRESGKWSGVPPAPDQTI